MARRIVTVAIPKTLREAAKAHGVNMSAVTRAALVEEIRKRTVGRDKVHLLEQARQEDW